MTELRLLAPDEIRAWEGRLWPYFESVCARSHGRYEPRHFLEWATKGEWQIWLALEGTDILAVCGTEVIIYPTGIKAINCRFVTGRGRQRWQHLITQIFAWAKSQGCELREGVTRKGWERVFPDWPCTHVYLEGYL